MIVYLATNKITGKHYVGITGVGLHERIIRHASSAKYKKNAMACAIAKYGIRSFVWEVLHLCSSKDEMYKMEMFYINKYNSISPNGYNLSVGGEHSALGVKHSAETRRKVSEGRRGKGIGSRSSEYVESLRARRYQEAEKGINCKIIPSEIPGIISLREQGVSYAKIATRYACTPSAVFYALRRKHCG